MLIYSASIKFVWFENGEIGSNAFPYQATSAGGSFDECVQRCQANNYP